MEKIVAASETIVTGLELDGTECAVKFSTTYTGFEVKNNSGSDITVSLHQGRTSGDGVATVPTGSGINYMHGQQLDTVYITGNGSVDVAAKRSPHLVFPTEAKGGVKKSDFDALSQNVDDISDDVDLLESRFDNAISAITTDTEVTDIRVGADGTTYQTAGEAVRGQVGELKQDIYDLKNIKTCKNILFKGTTNIVDGEFVDLDGTVTSASNYMHTEKIAMPCGSKIFGIGVRSNDGFLETLSMRFVSAYVNGRYNTYYGLANAKEYECVYVDGAEVTVSVNKGIYKDFYLYVVSEDGESINPINEKLKGKTVYGFGDSLVYGHYSKVGMLDMLCDNEGMIYKKYAVNGAKITGQWEILKQIILGDTEQPDFVIFDGGTNDAFTSSPIGEFSEEYTSQGYDTFIGAFDTVCNNIRVKYPNAKIIYVSPHKMPTSSFEIQKTIHDMALKVCDKYSISVVDIYSQGQINTNIETMKNEWSYDTEGATSGGNGTHLTGEGYYKFYAPMIKAKMLELLD